MNKTKHMLFYTITLALITFTLDAAQSINTLSQIEEQLEQKTQPTSSQPTQCARPPLSRNVASMVFNRSFHGKASFRYTLKVPSILHEIIQQAIQNKDSDQALTLLLVPVNIYTLTHEQFSTLFLAAATKGLDKVVLRIAILAFRSLDVTDTNGWTALMHAAYNGHEKVVELLLFLLAKTEPENTTGQTTSELARLRNHNEIYDKINLAISQRQREDQRIMIDTRDDYLAAAFRAFTTLSCEYLIKNSEQPTA